LLAERVISIHDMCARARLSCQLCRVRTYSLVLEDGHGPKRADR
jgi:hypothetical protein